MLEKHLNPLSAGTPLRPDSDGGAHDSYAILYAHFRTLLKKVSYKEVFCVKKYQRQSCKAFIGLSVRK